MRFIISSFIDICLLPVILAFGRCTILVWLPITLYTPSGKYSAVAVACLQFLSVLCLLVSYIMWFHPLLIAAALLVLFQTYRVEADTASHKYKKDEHIELWVNKVRIRQTPKRHVVCVYNQIIHSFILYSMYVCIHDRSARMPIRKRRTSITNCPTALPTRFTIRPRRTVGSTN
jgi:hypothetical protein